MMSKSCSPDPTSRPTISSTTAGRTERMLKRRRAEAETNASAEDDCPVSSSNRLTALTAQMSTFNASQAISQYECPVCMDYIQPPILQCTNAHLFCKPCRQRFEQQLCPTCREQLPNKDIRCYPMEKMASTLMLMFPCKYRSNGCPVTTLFGAKARHEKTCEFRCYLCPHVYGSCQFLGSKDAIFFHLSRQHEIPHTDIDGKYVVGLDVNDITEQKYHRWRELLTFDGQHFMYVLAKQCETFNMIVVFIGEQKMANHYKYKVEIKSDNDDSQMTFVGRPKSIRNGISALVFLEEGLHFTSQVVRRCFKCGTNRSDILLEITKG